MRKTIQAQVLYDARDERALISGTDLYELFRAVCAGEPSPAGRTEISVIALRNFAMREPYYAEFVADVLHE